MNLRYYYIPDTVVFPNAARCYCGHSADKVQWKNDKVCKTWVRCKRGPFEHNAIMRLEDIQYAAKT